MALANYIPDEVIIRLFEAHAPRCDIRTVARQWRDLIDARFEIRHFSPPAGRSFTVDFEIDRNMTKHLYCAQFGGRNAGAAGDISGKVTFVDWVPAYLRNVRDRHVRHEIDERDACELWRCVAKVRQRSRSSSGSDASTRAQSPEEGLDVTFGHLTISEDTGCDSGSLSPSSEHRREVIGKLSAVEVDQVLRVIDYRRNSGARWTEGNECRTRALTA